MTDAQELKLILSDAETDQRYLQKFSELLKLKHPELTHEELKARWVELKKDAGLIDA